MSGRGLRERVLLGLEHARHVPGLRKDLLTLVGLVVLGMVVGGYIISNQRFNWPWADEITLVAEFESAPGISPGNGQEVRVAGVPVGDVRKAEVTEKGTAQLTMAVAADQAIYRNARLVLRPKSPLNEMYVEISPGGPPAERVTSGASFPLARTANPVQADEVLQHLDDRSRAAVTDLLAEADVALARMPANLPGGLAATDQTLTDLQPVVRQLQTRRGRIRDLVTALARISSAAGQDDERLARLATSMEQTLLVLARNDDRLAATLQQLPGVTGELRRAMGSTQRLTEELDPALDGVRRASGELPGALARLTDTVRRVDETVKVARPVVAKARPVVADLRPVAVDAGAALRDLRPVTARLEPVTAALMPYLTDLRAFVYNTSSVTSLEDANGGILRGLLVISPKTLPVKARSTLLGEAR